MALVLNSKQFAAYHSRLAEQFRPTIMRGVRAGAARAIPYLVDRTRTAPPANPGGVGTGGAVNTGAFARSWRAIPLPDGAALTNSSSYAPVIEYGRRPGTFPPKAPLIEWIKRRLLTKPKTKKRRGPRESAESSHAKAEQRRLEAAIKRVGAHDPKYGPRRRPPDARKAKGRRIASLDDQAARLYFPIARAIARRGLIGRKIITAQVAQDAIIDIVQREVAAELGREMGRQ